MSTEMPPVGPLERGLAVLRALAQAPGGRMSAGELATATGLARSPVDRIATTLTRLGHVRTDGRDLVLAPPVMALGGAYLRASGIPARLGPLAGALADQLDESVSLAVPDGTAVRFVVQHTRRRALSVAFRVGDVLPAERCAPGALFAGGWTPAEWAAWRERVAADPHDEGFPALPARTRPTEVAFRDAAETAGSRGYAVDDQLVEPGLVALAVPVRDPDGRIVAALSVVSHTSRHSAAGLQRYALDPLRRTADRMTAALGAGVAAEPARPATDGTPDAKRELGAEYLQSLARGLAVLTALGTTSGGMTLSAVAQATGLARATVRRSLLTVQELGYVALDDGLFRPLPRVLELGYATLVGSSLGELAQPHLADLVATVHESASLAVLDGTDIRYVARVAASRIMSVSITVGTRFPAHATSMGRVLLAGLPSSERAGLLARAELAPITGRTVTDPGWLAAELERVAHDGYALVDQELEEGLRSVAVPVRDRDGAVIAAVNVSLHAGRTSAERARATILPALRVAADRISADVAVVTESGSLATS